MQVSIKLEYIKESLRDAGNSWHTWAIADENGGRASGWNGSRHAVPAPKQADLQELAKSELFQNVANEMNSKDYDYWPDDGKQYASLGLPDGYAVYAYDDGVWIVDTKDSCNMNDAEKLVCITVRTFDNNTGDPAINYHDNGKLAYYLNEHNIKVLACTPHTITVESQYCKDGKHYTEAETIRATMPAVRNYLGY